jgi:hypothetical protein
MLSKVWDAFNDDSFKEYQGLAFFKMTFWKGEKKAPLLFKNGASHMRKL